MKSQRVLNDEDVREIFYKVAAGVPQEYSSQLKFHVVHSPRVNAYIDGDNNIVIFNGMIKALKYNKNAIAWVIGHEVAHGFLSHNTYENWEHTSETVLGLSQMKELQSDYVGFALAQRAGYNACEGKQLMEYLMVNYGDRVHTKAHPQSGIRFSNLYLMCI